MRKIAICKVGINNMTGWRDRPRPDFAILDQCRFHQTNRSWTGQHFHHGNDGVLDNQS